jgi:hypothetical protein
MSTWRPTHPPIGQTPKPERSAIQWLLDLDPSIRWQVLRDLTRAPTDGRWALGIVHPEEVTAEPGITEGSPSRWITLRALRVLDWYSAQD